uniref:Guanylate cyclase n=1 Tax=Parascaris univalens TaxID=6257 RepID=A0A915BLZ7_PARUN
MGHIWDSNNNAKAVGVKIQSNKMQWMKNECCASQHRIEADGRTIANCAVEQKQAGEITAFEGIRRSSAEELTRIPPPMTSYFNMLFIHIWMAFVQFHLHKGEKRKVVVGLLMTKDSPDISALVGYQSSASAVMIAMDRVEDEGLLPDINVTFKWYFDECEPYLTSGYSTRLIIHDDVDVILGPTCPASAMLAGSVVRFYDFPLYAWGTIMPNEMTYTAKYPTVVVTIPSSIPNIIFLTVVAACLEMDDQRREFMKGVLNAGMNTDDYVYIFLESRKEGYGNKPLWINMGEHNDGLDNQIKAACKQLLIAAVQAPYLADAMYLYARALNKTLNENPKANIRNGSALTTASQGSFEGYSGRVLIDKDGNRNAIYNLYGFNIDEVPEKFVDIEMDQNTTKWIPQYKNAATSIWAIRGGKQPVAVPECGFSGSECPPDFMNTYFVYVLACVIILLIIAFFAIAASIYILNARKKEQKRLDQLWQINYVALIKPSEQTEAGKSVRSIKSFASSASAHLASGKALETNTHAFYYLSNVAVVARKHTCRPQIEKKHAAELRLGLYAIHHSLIGQHGHLTSSACLVNERWQVKINNFGLSFLKEAEPRPEYTLLWTAPELLREGNNVGTKKGDIYSFAIICSEIITGKSAFNIDEREESVEELVYKIKRIGPHPFRPVVTTADVQDMDSSVALSGPMSDMICEGRNLIDHVFNMLEQYATNLECEVEERTKELVEEKKKCDLLLQRMLPKEVAEKLKLGLTVPPESYDSATVFFSDVVKFTDLASKCTPLQVNVSIIFCDTVAGRSCSHFSDVSRLLACLKLFQAVFTVDGTYRNVPEELKANMRLITQMLENILNERVVNLLNDLYTTFDTIIDEHHVYKVETIGDSYLCVSGLPQRNGNEHARNVAQMSFAFLKSLATFRIPHLPAERINIRIGIHTGPVVAGVVGLTMPRYCLFGDTVNTASRMESNGKRWGKVLWKRSGCYEKINAEARY